LWPSNPVAQSYWVRSRDTTKPQQLAVVPGTAFMIRRRVFEKIGGFDPQFFIYFEESDLCRRVRAEGWEVWLTPDSHLKHIWHAATQDSKYNRIYRESRFKYFAQYNGVVMAYLVEAALRVGKWELVTLFGATLIVLSLGIIIWGGK
jgi:N-acetylglucosaminyl-diphospho-decaprenol L-rhamnosyltransferase